MRKNWSSDWEFEFSNFFRSLENNLFEQWKAITIFETEYFLNLLLEVSTDHVITLDKLNCQLEQTIGMLGTS